MDELPHASTAVHVLIVWNVQPLTGVSVPTTPVGVTVPQLSDAVALPKAALTCAGVGLQIVIGVPAAMVITGAVISTIQLTVLEIVAELPHASVAVNVLVCDLLHPLLVTSPSLCVIVAVPHASVAVADPSAVVGEVGLQPRF